MNKTLTYIHERQQLIKSIFVYDNEWCLTVRLSINNILNSTDDDGDGVSEEDCAKPYPSRYP